MFNIGDKVFYGQTGVCIVEDISEKAFNKNLKGLYYTLRPIYQHNNIIYAPACSDKIFIRKIISKYDAQKLIEIVPELWKKAFDGQSEEDYKSALESHSCEELLELVIKIYSKKQAAKQIKKLGFTDEKYLKRAEELLFGELAAALDISLEEVPKVLFEKL